MGSGAGCAGVRPRAPLPARPSVRPCCLPPQCPASQGVTLSPGSVASLSAARPGPRSALPSVRLAALGAHRSRSLLPPPPPTQHDTFQVGEHTASRPALRLLGVVTRAALGSGHLGAPLSAKGHGGWGRTRVGRQVLWFLRDGMLAGAGLQQVKSAPCEHSRGTDAGRAGIRGAARPAPPTAPTKQRLCPAPRRPNAHPGWPPGRGPAQQAVCPKAGLSVPQGRPTSPPSTAPHVRRGRTPSQRHPSEKLAPNEGGIGR